MSFGYNLGVLMKHGIATLGHYDINMSSKIFLKNMKNP